MIRSIPTGTQYASCVELQLIRGDLGYGGCSE
jgi:hypothetical protein